jgi:uncharacterized protein YndB with AHSA1/START domain
MTAMDARAARETWALDREIVLTRVFDAPRDLVFKAWTEKEHISRWFGPKGFTTTTHEMDVRVGGMWRFEMLGPDGKRYDNRVVYLEIKKPERLVFDHGHDKDDDATRFRVTITFDEQSDGKTVVTLRQLHPTKAQRDAGIGFGAVELGQQTLDKLSEHLQRLPR